MGNWGYGIFDGDNENDAMDDYDQMRTEGVTPTVAFNKTIEDDAYDEEEEEALLTVVLAAHQMMLGELNKKTQGRAIKTLDTATAGDRLIWSDDDEEPFSPRADRVAMLTKLRAALVAYDPQNPTIYGEDETPEFLQNNFLAPKLAAFFNSQAGEDERAFE
jgi:hypothetical protein